MNRTVQRILVLAAAFAAGLGIVFWLNSRRTNREIVYTVMDEATLPTISFRYQGETINTLRGFKEPMDAAYLQESMIPAEGDRTLTLRVTSYGRRVGNISYELRDGKDRHLIENGEATSRQEWDGGFDMSLQLGELIREDQEYYLCLILRTAEQENLYYYTRLRYDKEDGCLAAMLPLAQEFSASTFDKSKRGWIAAYLETDAALAGDSLGHVTIKDTRDQVTWGDLDPVRLKAPEICVNRISQNQASLLFTYEIEAREEESTTTRRYHVREYFTFRNAYSNTYLITYDRTMHEEFDPVNAIDKDHIDFGILENGDFPISQNGDYTVFALDGELWEYGRSDNEVIRIFSFKEASDDGVRTQYDRHGFRIIRVQETGDVDFLVCGYMNRGLEEGRCGLLFCRYEKESNNLSELFFIPSDRPYEVLQEETDKLFCVGADGQVYLICRGTLYAIDLVGNEPIEIANGLREGSYQISGDQKILAWQEGGGELGGTSIVLLYLEDGHTKRLSAGIGEYLRAYGFLDTDFAYGMVRESDRNDNASFRWQCPAYALEIIDEEGTLQKRYEVANMYISSVVISEDRIIVGRCTKQADGSFLDAEGDTLILLDERKQTDAPEVTRVNSGVRQKTWQLSFRSKEQQRRLSVSLPKQVNGGENARVNLTGSEDASLTRFYSYQCGGLAYVGYSLAEAIQAIYDHAGFVYTSGGLPVWERAGLREYLTLSLPEMVTAQSDGDRKRACLSTMLQKVEAPLDTSDEANQGASTLEIVTDSGVVCPLNLEGATVQQILYYVAKGWPVFAYNSAGQAELIVGYDVYNIAFYDAVDGAIYKVSRDDAEVRYGTLGYLFLSCVN